MARLIRSKVPVFSLALLFIIFTHAPAQAVTAEDVLEKMSTDQRSGYLAGLVDMMSYQKLLEGNEPQAECIVTWFYDRDGSLKKVLTAFERFRDKAAEGILVLMARKSCEASASVPQQSGK